MWINYGFWNYPPIYHENFNDLQDKNIYCLGKNKEKRL